jgi:hypothetical protein
MPDEPTKPPEAQSQEKKLDVATLFIGIMKEHSLATQELRVVLEEVRDALLDSNEFLDSLNTHVIGLNVAMARQTHVEDELLAITVGNPHAKPPVPGREPTTMDRLRIIQEYEENLEKEAKKDEEDERKRQEAMDLAIPPKPEPTLDQPSMITSQPSSPSMLRPHHPLPVVRPSANLDTLPSIK